VEPPQCARRGAAAVIRVALGVEATTSVALRALTTGGWSSARAHRLNDHRWSLGYTLEVPAAQVPTDLPDLTFAPSGGNVERVSLAGKAVGLDHRCV
jgi:hypothetical protein